MPARIGRLSAGVGYRHPVTIRKASLMARSIGGHEDCGPRQKRSTVRLNVLGLGWLFATLLLQHPNRIFELIWKSTFIRKEKRPFGTFLVYCRNFLFSQ